MSDELDLEGEERALGELFATVPAPASLRERWAAADGRGRPARRARRFLGRVLIGAPGERRLRPLAAALMIPVLALAVAGGFGLRARLAMSSASGPSPMARSQPAMAFDAARGDVVMFGGQIGGGVALGDTWTWDGSWHQQHPALSPTPRFGAAMGYDPHTQQVVLVGGISGSRSFPDQGGTWTWDGSNWHQVATAHVPPFFSGGTQMADDPSTGQLVLVTTVPQFFGAPAPGGGGFVDVSPVQVAPGASAGGSAHAPALPAMSPRPAVPVVSPRPATGPSFFVGPTSPPVTVSPQDYQRRTWVWSGGDWVEQTAGTRPAGSLGPSGLAYDGSLKRLVLIESQLGMCSATVSGSVGAQRSAGWSGYVPMGGSSITAAPPSPVSSPAHCTPQSQLRWTWDGHAWAKAAPAPNGPLSGTMVALPDGSGLLLRSGSSTWLGRGTAWTYAATTAALIGRSGYGLVSDPAQGVVLLFGGIEGAAFSADTWTWDSGGWTHVGGTVPPTPSPFVPGRAPSQPPLGHPVILRPCAPAVMPSPSGDAAAICQP
ncbi:MAG TPA: hypothetical protein VFC09_04740 [Candidatus Dormibacteraeota bacterium]|nr:hypothetical protein [Candidatus Dormibacteraeota bacterium]